EAAAELLISHRAWLLREDFLQGAVEAGWEPFRGRQVAAGGLAAGGGGGAGGRGGSGRGGRGGGGGGASSPREAGGPSGACVWAKQRCAWAGRTRRGPGGRCATRPAAAPRWGWRLTGDRRAARHGDDHAPASPAGRAGAAGAGRDAPARAAGAAAGAARWQ